MKFIDIGYENYKVLTLLNIHIVKAEINNTYSKYSILKDFRDTEKGIMLEKYIDIPNGLSYIEIKNMVQSRVMHTITQGDNIVVEDEDTRLLFRDTFNVISEGGRKDCVHIHPEKEVVFYTTTYTIYKYKNTLIYLHSDKPYESLMDYIRTQYESDIESILNSIPHKEIDIITNAKQIYFGKVLIQYENYDVLYAVLGNIKGVSYLEEAIKVSFSKKDSLDIVKIQSIYSLINSEDLESVNYGINLVMEYNICEHPYSVMMLLNYIKEYCFLEGERLNSINRLSRSLHILLEYSKWNINEEDKYMLQYLIQEAKTRLIKRYVKEYTGRSAEVDLKITIH